MSNNPIAIQTHADGSALLNLANLVQTTVPVYVEILGSEYRLTDYDPERNVFLAEVRS